jgi:hypothetical protein
MPCQVVSEAQRLARLEHVAHKDYQTSMKRLLRDTGLERAESADGAAAAQGASGGARSGTGARAE